MKNKGHARLVEWGKSLLILLLFVSAVFLLSRTQLSSGIADTFRGWLGGEEEEDSQSASAQTALAAVHPVRMAVYQDGRRYGVQYDQEATDAVFESMSTLFSEALVSAGTPEKVSDKVWRTALCSTGIYLDFLYTAPMTVLSSWLGDGQGNAALTGSARRICLAADKDGGVSLFYINEEDGSCYACPTTLSPDFHLNAAVAEWAPNGAMFAFEVEGMDALGPYTLLTSTPESAICTAVNPLPEDAGRLTQLLNTLGFSLQGSAPELTQGGQLVEGNDSLRLSADGLVSFHTMGDSGYRFAIPEDSLQGTLDYVRSLAENTAGLWCGQARLCLAGVEQTADGLEIIFQYTLNGAAVALPEDRAAARFVVSGGAVTDFTLYLRSYAAAGETSLVLPEALAAAAMEPLNTRGKELALIYQDSGTEQVSAGWFAV